MPTTDLDPSAWSDWLNNFFNRPYQTPGGGNEFVNPQTLPDIYRGGPGAITSGTPGAPMQLQGAMPPMPAGGALANGGGGAPPFIGGAGGGGGGGGGGLPAGALSAPSGGGAWDPLARFRGLSAAGVAAMAPHVWEGLKNWAAQGGGGTPNSAWFGGDTGGYTPSLPAAPQQIGMPPGPMDPSIIARQKAGPAAPSTAPPAAPAYNPLAGKPTGVPYYNPLANQPTGVPYRAPNPATSPGRPAPIAPNLSYYAPTGGNARGATPMAYLDPNDPRIYRGPLSMFGRG
jgi:hypothetical protein